MKYKERVSDAVLKLQLECMGAVLIEGAKWCGKTTSAEHFANSVLYLDNPKNKAQNLALADTNPELLLQGKTPKLIDEWQLAPKLWDAIRFEVDHRRAKGQFILTGSAVPADMREVSHSGTGRFAWVTMRPMSLFESGDSTGAVSLRALFEGNTDIGAVSEKDLEDIAYYICRGGWPGCLEMGKDAALTVATNYHEAIVKQDISRVDGVQRSEQRCRRLMRALARHQGDSASLNAIAEDISANEAEAISAITVSDYVEALKKIFVIEDMEAWNPNLRSRTAIRTSDTHYFTDPSIAAASLGLGPKDLINDLNTMGLFFETLCVRDLRVFANAIGGDVYHFRDKNGLECDAVVHLRNGKYGLIEIKLGGDRKIEEGVKTLTALSNKIDTDKMNEPSFKMILTATGQYAYKRKDGILIVPIATLGA